VPSKQSPCDPETSGIMPGILPLEWPQFSHVSNDVLSVKPSFFQFRQEEEMTHNRRAN
jgi:hypothetical protein